MVEIHKSQIMQILFWHLNENFPYKWQQDSIMSAELNKALDCI